MFGLFSKKETPTPTFEVIEGVVARFGALCNYDSVEFTQYTLQLEGQSGFYLIREGNMAHNYRSAPDQNYFEHLWKRGTLALIHSTTKPGDRVRLTQLNGKIVVAFCNLTLWDMGEEAPAGQASYQAMYNEVQANSRFPDEQGHFSCPPELVQEYLQLLNR